MENNTTFWGYPVKGRNEYKAKIEAVQNELTINKGKLRSLVSQDKGLSTEAITIQGKIDDLEKALSDLRSKDITGVNTFADQSIDNRPDYVPPVPGFSLAELTGGRAPIVKNRKRLVSHKPGDTTIAQRVNEGEVSDPVEVLDLLDAVRTENEDHIFLCDTLNVPESVKNDEPQVMNAATAAAHEIHMVNGENAQAFALLEAAQEPVRVHYGTGVLCREINKRISGDHKKNTVIITNKGGFAALDGDVNGVPQIKRGADGQLMYKEKYPIIEVDDNVLPNVGKEIPVFVGDLAKALRFFLIRDAAVECTEGLDFMHFTVKDRLIREEIIKVTTASPEVWFWMTLVTPDILLNDLQDNTGDENQPSEDQPPVIDAPTDDPQPPEDTEEITSDSDTAETA